MKGNELRQAYLQFFESKGHLKIRQFFSYTRKRSISIIDWGRYGAIKRLSLQVNWYLLVIVLQQAKKCMRTGDLENVRSHSSSPYIL